MSKTRRHSFDVATVGEQYSGRGVAQTMKLEMTYIVPCEKMRELLRGRVRVHYVSKLIGEYIIKILPSRAKREGIGALKFFIFL